MDLLKIISKLIKASPNVKRKNVERGTKKTQMHKIRTGMEEIIIKRESLYTVLNDGIQTYEYLDEIKLCYE